MCCERGRDNVEHLYTHVGMIQCMYIHQSRNSKAEDKGGGREEGTQKGLCMIHVHDCISDSRLLKSRKSSCTPLFCLADV